MGLFKTESGMEKAKKFAERLDDDQIQEEILIMQGFFDDESKMYKATGNIENLKAALAALQVRNAIETEKNARELAKWHNLVVEKRLSNTSKSWHGMRQVMAANTTFLSAR